MVAWKSPSSLNVWRAQAVEGDVILVGLRARLSAPRGEKSAVRQQFKAQGRDFSPCGLLLLFVSELESYTVSQRRVLCNGQEAILTTDNPTPCVESNTFSAKIGKPYGCTVTHQGT